MKFAALALLGLCSLAACNQRPGDETGRAAEGADTVVTTEQNVDTAIVTTDTTVDVDTTKKEGDQPVSRDTVSNTGSMSNDTLPSDTAR
ncbi:MAG TPA: hypothetical protein VH764_02785 [Gemmatimonadales bacterium]|jgi:hypothetical protein